MVSFDVKSLFTNVPISGALSCLEKRLKEFHYSAFEIDELITLTRTCLSQTTFSFQGHFYKQSEGLAMGSPLSPILADIYMHYFENTLFEKISFPFWTRYVDDTFTLIDTSLHNVDHILQTMNSIDNNIQFTCEIEKNSVLPFLGTLVYRTDEGFSASVYRKNFAVFLPPHARSCNLPRQKMATFYTFVNRALNICSNPISFNSEIQYLKAIAFVRDYNPSIVDKALFKLQNPRLLHPSWPNLNINIIIPYFSKIKFFHCQIS